MPGTAEEDLVAARARGDIVDDTDSADPPAGDDTAAGADASGDDTAAGADASGDDTAAGADDKPAKKVDMIPKVRFDEARRKDRERIQALERELQASKKGGDVPTVAQRIKTLEEQSNKLSDEYAKALDVGDTKKAKELLNQIRQLDRETVRIESAATAAHERALAVEQVRLDMLIDSLEEKYPQLKEGSDDYDQDLVEELGELRVAFESRGMSSSEALKRAVRYVLREDAKSAKDKAAIDEDIEDAADKADKAADKAEKAKKIGQARTAEAVRRNLEIARRQPADLSKGAGADSHKLGGGIDLESVASMSDKDFDALPDATKRKLRGDHFATST